MLTRSRNFFNRMKASLQASKETLSALAPMICPTKKSRIYIACSMVLIGAGIGLSALTSKIYGELASVLTTDDALDLLGVEITPIELTAIYGGVSILTGVTSTLRALVLTPIGPLASKKLASEYVESQIRQSYKNDINTPSGLHNGMIGKCYMAPTNLNIFNTLVEPVLSVLFAMVLLTEEYGAPIGLSLGGILVAYTAFNVLTKNTIADRRNDMLKHGFNAYETMVAALDNYLTIHLFGKDKYEIEKVNKALERCARADTRGNAIISQLGVGQVFISGLGITAVCVLAAYGVLNGQKYQVSDFVFITTYLNNFTVPLNTFGTALNMAFAALEEWKAVKKRINASPSVVDAYPSVMLEVKSDIGAGIEFRNVSFEYEEIVKTEEDKKTPEEKRKPAELKKMLVLDDISFVIKPGESIGFVGTSGAGKSTIIHLLYRLFDVTKGTILIDGQDIRSVSLESLRKIIGVVPQTTPLFADTIYNNIAYGAPCPPEEVKREDVFQAIEDANLTVTIGKLKNKHETVVGERGARLSGGQRQRVAIARSLLKKPKIQVFDEATSALDAIAEREVQRNIEKNAAKTTSIFIAHRLTTLRKVGKIFVLKDGKIAETGCHAELIQKPDGIYADLWRQQQMGDDDVTMVPEVKASGVIGESKKTEVEKVPLQTSQAGMFARRKSVGEMKPECVITVLPLPGAVP